MSRRWYHAWPGGHKQKPDNCPNYSIVRANCRARARCEYDRLMKKGLSAALCLVAAFTAPSPAASGRLTVLMSGGFFDAYQHLLPEFEKDTGIIVTTAR